MCSAAGRRKMGAGCDVSSRMCGPCSRDARAGLQTGGRRVGQFTLGVSDVPSMHVQGCEEEDGRGT